MSNISDFNEKTQRQIREQLSGAKVAPSPIPERKNGGLSDGEPFSGRESELHRQIEEELKRRRWFYVHSRTDKRTTQQLGIPDFIIARPSRLVHRGGGSDTELPDTLWIEVKKKGNKLTPEQTITKHVLTALGHNYSTVYSFAQFLEVIK